IHVGSSRAILGADALLLCLSSPFKIASSGFVSSLRQLSCLRCLFYCPNPTEKPFGGYKNVRSVIRVSECR
ncbi:hypothetical protein GBM01_21840, partial [Yersinia pseudotuberculosis]|nr:hypothetical protein [Yersinia pseudotuberculosis]